MGLLQPSGQNLIGEGHFAQSPVMFWTYMDPARLPTGLAKACPP